MFDLNCGASNCLTWIVPKKTLVICDGHHCHKGVGNEADSQETCRNDKHHHGRHRLGDVNHGQSKNCSWQAAQCSVEDAKYIGHNPEVTEVSSYPTTLGQKEVQKTKLKCECALSRPSDRYWPVVYVVSENQHGSILTDLGIIAAGWRCLFC